LTSNVQRYQILPQRLPGWEKGTGTYTVTSVQNNLDNGRTPVLSPLTMANAFVQRMCWAGTFVISVRQTTQNAVVHRYVTMSGKFHSKVPFSWEVLDPI